MVQNLCKIRLTFPWKHFLNELLVTERMYKQLRNRKKVGSEIICTFTIQILFWDNNVTPHLATIQLLTYFVFYANLIYTGDKKHKNIDIYLPVYTKYFFLYFGIIVVLVVNAAYVGYQSPGIGNIQETKQTHLAEIITSGGFFCHKKYRFSLSWHNMDNLLIVIKTHSNMMRQCMDTSEQEQSKQ